MPPTREQQIEQKKLWALDVKRKFREKRNVRNFFKLIQIFCLQLILLFSLLYSFFISRLLETEDILREEDEYPYLTFISKWACAILVHINMQPKLAEALQRFIYIKNHPHKFESVTIALVICFMKIFVEFLVESINIAATSLMTSVPDVIMNYVALASIGELDEIYYNSIRSPLKDELEERDFELPIKNQGKGTIKHEMHWIDVNLLKIVSVIHFFYDTL